jgi:hypothetical protein
MCGDDQNRHIALDITELNIQMQNGGVAGIYLKKLTGRSVPNGDLHKAGTAFDEEGRSFRAFGEMRKNTIYRVGTDLQTKPFSQVLGPQIGDEVAEPVDVYDLAAYRHRGIAERQTAGQRR